LINLYAFTLLRNGIKYDYSFKESLLSLVPIVKNIYLALDNGEDNTEEEIKKISSVKIISSLWDMSIKKGHVLSVETNKALKALRAQHGEDENAWGIYLQADEVLHQDDYEILKEDLERAQAQGCDAIAFRYLHVWQTHHHLSIAKNWYPEEIRAIKLKSPILSYGDAQGFTGQSKIFRSEVRIFHYGHVRDQSIYKNKMEDMSKLYDEDATKSKYYNAKDRDKDQSLVLKYFGSHPNVMRERILRMNDIFELPDVPEVYIVGNPEKYTESFLTSIKSKNIYWLNSTRQISKDKSNKSIVVIDQRLFDKFFFKSNVPKKMLSKNAREWSPEFYLTLKLSEKNIGLTNKTT